jgi:hypothetical protein
MIDSATKIGDVDVTTLVATGDKAVEDKELHELTIDEAIAKRTKDFFPTREKTDGDSFEVARPYSFKPRIEAAFVRSLKSITKEHPHSNITNNRFIGVVLGLKIIVAGYPEEIAFCKERYDRVSDGDDSADDDDDDNNYFMVNTHNTIQQDGSTDQIQIGFTLHDRDEIQELADVLGLCPAALLVAAWWHAAATSDHLNEKRKRHAAKMIGRFKKHLAKRVNDFNLISN